MNQTRSPKTNFHISTITSQQLMWAPDTVTDELVNWWKIPAKNPQSCFEEIRSLTSTKLPRAQLGKVGHVWACPGMPRGGSKSTLCLPYGIHHTKNHKLFSGSWDIQIKVLSDFIGPFRPKIGGNGLFLKNLFGPIWSPYMPNFTPEIRIIVRADFGEKDQELFWLQKGHFLLNCFQKIGLCHFFPFIDP